MYTYINSYTQVELNARNLVVVGSIPPEAFLPRV